ncbi:TIM barrel protein [Microbacterium sp. W1N]|uniref:TIM barrel protein n=1 Tax=Microbacterium festucae TaxID=2977531 RepID=UPI0021C09469|nr:TIM barrel protein [Microbacterium festucae]MCT9819852.1 TIM barrel protein [Microbacterium festucae]
MNAYRRPRDVLISTVCLSGTLEDKLHAAAEAGFAGVELLEYDLLMSSWSPSKVASEASDLGLAVEVYQPFHVETVPTEAFARHVHRAERKLDLLGELGARVLVCCSTKTAEGVDDDERAADQLHALAERAHARGIRLAYEAVPWGRVRTHDEAWRVVERVGHLALGLCLDSFHVLSRENRAAAIEGIPVDKVFHVQLADAPRPGIDVLEWSLHHRLFPGQGSLEVGGFVGRLRAGGYDGPIALEVFNDVYQQEDPRHTATDAMRSIRVLAEAVSRGDAPAARTPTPRDLPSAPALAGLAFVELAVDEVSGPLVARSLRALGFAQTGQHRSKPVQLWEQADARVLLNFGPERSVSPATASISAMGVASADPAGSLRRAESLLASRLARPRGPRELDLASVATPGGVALFFCEPDAEQTWETDFERDEEVLAPPPLVREIDHVAMTEVIDHFDQSTLFFRTVLGLVDGTSQDITAPFGLVRTWSARDRDERVRVVLNTTPLRRGDWAPAVSSPQCIAFSTDDAVACARALRDRGAPILRIPDNYYDDLEARLDLSAEFVATLREHSILYHRDAEGVFLHLFTEMVGARIFFEIVQRIDGYDGYGDPRSIPLRMAAHRRQRMRTLGARPSAGDADNRREYSLAHLTALSLTPPELVDAAASAGYRYVGLRMTKVTTQEPHYPLASDPALMRATKTHLAATGVEVLDIELARMTSGDNPRDYLRFLEAGAELGARHVITQLPDADFARKTDRFAELCQLAAPLGLSIDLEFPSWTETPNLTEAVRVLRGAAQPNAGLLIDLLHFARSGSSIEALRDLPPEWFHYAHVCDAPAEIPTTTSELIHTARFERLFPGEGGLDMHGILAALPEGIPYALEIPRAMLVAQVGPKEHARLAIDAARRHLDAVPVSV